MLGCAPKHLRMKRWTLPSVSAVHQPFYMSICSENRPINCSLETSFGLPNTREQRNHEANSNMGDTGCEFD